MSDGSSNARKLDHIELAMLQGNSRPVSAGWDDIHLQPVALPNIDLGDVQVQTSFLGHELHAPILIAGMTGGHPETQHINKNLAIATNECKIAMGVGSQRAALVDPEMVSTYAVARKCAPDAFICGNIGISQIANRLIGKDQIKLLVDMVGANAIAVHINVLQELIQPEGEIALRQALPALADFVKQCPVPIIVKETGCGLDEKTALRLCEAGVTALDVGGAGGTSFVNIEGARAEKMGAVSKARLSQSFSHWGLSTVASLKQMQSVTLPIVATGGIKNGLDVAKAISLGADLAGVGSQMLGAALKGPDEAILELTSIIEELRIAMVLTECSTLSELQAVDSELK